ncbi:MAG TPA: FlgD immunoglobulin-like domain containing protein, partial [Spirochaetia bacterium]|nr:FlgD immunoglobulin-like domain containing protein [Spirochaetia bacterium]
YTGGITLEADTTLTGFSGSFSTTITGAGHNLTLAFTSTLALGTTSLSGVAALTSNGPVQLSGTITTSGAQSYNGSAQLIGAATLNATGVSFGSTLDANASGYAFTVAVGTGSASFNSTVGATNALGATSITANSLGFGGGASSVHGNSTLLIQGATAGTSVDVGGTASGTLVVSAADVAALASGFTQVQIGAALGTAAVTVVGSSTFSSPLLLQSNGVGGSVVVDAALASGANAMTLTAPTIDLNSAVGNVVSTTNATISFNGAVLLTAAATIASAGGAVSFSSTVDSIGATPFALTVNKVGGLLTFSGAAGVTHALASLSTDTGTTAINGGAVTTTGAQTYTGAVTLGANTTLTGGAGQLVWIKSTLDGAHTFAVAVANAQFDGAVGTTALTSLSVAGTTALNGGPITTTGAQTYTGAATLGAATTLTSAAGQLVWFKSTLNGGQTFAVVTANAQFDGAVGATALASLSAGGTTAINGGSVTTTGAQTYTGAVTLGTNTTLTGGAGAITTGGVTAAGFNLILVNSGGATLASVSLGAGTFDLASVTGGTVTVSGATNASSLTTAAAAYSVVLGGGGTVAVAVTFSNTGTLTIGSGFAFTNGVTATAPSLSSLAGTITATANNLTFGAATVTANATLNPSAGSIAFTGNLTINGGATLNPSGRDVSAGGNWTDNGAYTATTETVTFNGASATTLTAGVSPFFNVTLSKGAAGTTVALGSAATVNGILQVSTGTLRLNGRTLTLANALDLNSANGTLHLDVDASALAMAGHLLTVSAGTLLHDAATTTMSVTASGLTMNGGTYTGTGAGTITLTGPILVTAGTLSLGAKTVSAVGVTQSNGTLDAGSAQVTSSSGVALTGGTFTQGTSLFTMTGNGTTVQVASPRQLYSLTIGNGGSGTVTVTGGPLSMQGDLTVTAGWTFTTAPPGAVDVTGNSAVAGTLALGGSNFTTNNLMATGLVAAAASEVITVNGSLDFSTAGIHYTPQTSTIVMGGAATPVTINAPADSFYAVQVAKAGGGTVDLASAITVTSSLTIASGALSALTNTITMQGTAWTNLVGAAGFLPGTGNVKFTTNATVTIMGDNDWFDFTCSITSGPGKTIIFEALKTQKVIAGGHFNVTGYAGGHIVLTSTSSSTSNYGSPPPDLQGQWVINNVSVLPQSIDYVDVSFSYAIVAITPGPNAIDQGNNHNWNFVIPIQASWTLDSSTNGRIDRIRVQVTPGTQLNISTGGFGGFVAQVVGYSIAGYAAVNGNTDVFDINLVEGPAEDTSATPLWRVVSNTTLVGLVGGALVNHDPTAYYQAASGAAPVITFTAAAINSTKVYVHFSSLAYGNASGGALPATGLFAQANVGTATPIEKSGNGAHSVIVTLTGSLLATDIFPPNLVLSANAGAIFGTPYPGTFNYPTQGGTSSPHTSSSGDPATYANATSDGLLVGGGASMLTTPHAISDVGIGFVTPVFALDRDIVRDPVNGGIGLVNLFDGSKWLPPQNTLIETRVLVPVSPGSTVALYWDTNPPAALDFRNLWIPTLSSTLSPSGTDLVHYPGYDGLVGALAPSSVNGPLNDFLIPSSNPAIKDGAHFQFVLTLTDGLTGKVLPVVYQDPADPGAVRPFGYDLHSVIQQRGEVTISNNVINPGAGQVAHLHYVVPTSGQVTITVFTLNGDVVTVLARGTEAAGEYTTSWDGKDRGGRAVARGIYFVRVIGPGFDEVRKVLVVR